MRKGETAKAHKHDGRSKLQNDLLIKQVVFDLKEDPFWGKYLEDILIGQTKVNIHLGVFVEPYLEYIMEGKKTIESRFSVKRGVPYRRVGQGDVILLKRSGGPVIGVCLVSKCWFYDLDPESWHELRKDYSDALCAQDPLFWKQRENASYATLMHITKVRQTNPITIRKLDRRGWVIVKSFSKQTSLLEELNEG